MTPEERLDDRFELEQPIGTGGMGTVFRARDSISGAAVAVKVISDRSGQHAERFAVMCSGSGRLVIVECNMSM